MADAPPPCSSTKMSDYFDYDVVNRKCYMKQIGKIFSRKIPPFDNPWTRKGVDTIKEIIKQGLELQKAGKPRRHAKYMLMNKYEIIEKDNEEILILKRGAVDQPVIQVLPHEDSFKVLVKAHLATSHGKRDRILEKIRLQYSVPATSIPSIISACKVCQQSKKEKAIAHKTKPQTTNTQNVTFEKPKRKHVKKPPPGLFSSVNVYIINMAAQRDNQFSYILCYLDKCSNYLILRPLMTFLEDEVAMELLKIFLDFGAPETLQTHDKGYFTKTLNKVNTACEKFNIIVGSKWKAAEVGPHEVKDMLQKWQVETGSTNWALGCYMIQWKHNCTRGSSGYIPYEKVFNIKPRIEKDPINNKDPMNYSNVLESTVALDDDDVQLISETEDGREKVDEEILNNQDGVVKGDDDVQVTNYDDLESTEIICPDYKGDPLDSESLTGYINEVSEKNNDIQVTIIDPLKFKEMLGDNSLDKSYFEKQKEDLVSKQIVEVEEGNKAVSITNEDLVEPKKKIIKYIVPVKDKPATKIQTDQVSAQTQTKAQTNVKVTNPQNKILSKPTNKQCQVCGTNIDAPYICMKCNRNVHLFCSDRLLKPELAPEDLNVTCTHCKIASQRFESVKRKFHQMDNDIVDKH